MKIVLLLSFLFSSLLSVSQTIIPSFFSDNMILQQEANTPIWGMDNPGTPILINTSWGERKEVITSAKGIWKTTLKTKKASFEEQQIEIKGSSSIIILNILIGEVWFCSGQSNMEMPLKGFENSPINNSEKYINDATNTKIRLFNSSRGASLLPANNVKGQWEVANNESVAEFSALGYMFASKLFKKLNIPIGIIEASWGGTQIKSWIPRSGISNYKEIKIPEVLPTNQNKQKLPTLLYNAMIYPFQDYAIKGILWYQGESDRGSFATYKDYMHTLINSWRTQWDNDSLPFYMVQIAPYAYSKNRNTPMLYANLIREAQMQVAMETSNTAIVITTDAGSCDDIHPPHKEIIAARLSNLALSEQYKIKGLDSKSPVYKSMKIRKDKIILQFKFFAKKRKYRSFKIDEKLSSFYIAGNDHIFYPADAKINKNQTITVYSNKVKNPVAVSYGFEDCLQGSLFSASGLPVSPFRTDNWNK